MRRPTMRPVMSYGPSFVLFVNADLPDGGLFSQRVDDGATGAAVAAARAAGGSNVCIRRVEVASGRCIEQEWIR